MALRGIRVIELAGLAPAPFCGAILADFGATVIRVDKIDQSLYPDFLGHGKKSVAINLKNSTGVEIFRRLCKNSDILIEPFRKGVMEKLALGPQELLAENKRLIYARLTGFGQKGAYSKRAGHDINYVAMSGLLSMLGWESDRRPSPPLNLVADFAGGSVLCALGIMMALAERTRSGQGQVVDCSMVAGSAYLASWIFRGHGSQLWSRPRAKNFLDGGAFFYDTYETKDGNWMAVGALEPQFYSQLINGLGLDEEQVPQICSAEDGVKFRKLFAQIFKSKTRAEWCEIFDGLDACVTPILSLEEAALNQHNIDNKTFSKNDDGAFSPNPAPILSRTPAETNFHKCNPGSGDDTEQILVNDLGYSKTDVERFEDLGAIMRNKL